MSTYTEWYWTGSVYAFSRVCKQRLDPHTQKETRVLAQRISMLCRKAFPLSWSALHASAT
jgi:thymidylate synthase (FAD)